ncbi:hypothetical protein SCOCK_160085 [Actinacidiphila cocklensis]|uniref:Uncharacterized protein n=1 Tax=Actinacidiphila cocklensis TaxID=887465 RepID=A0A9W4DQQ8_9ACTN|nr:hypothetical protein SCOCK_160085 [Actinacidiphila cocklensis]
MPPVGQPAPDASPCVGQKGSTGGLPMVKRRENGQAKRLAWGSPWSPLSGSNRRPTLYKSVALAN